MFIYTSADIYEKLLISKLQPSIPRFLFGLPDNIDKNISSKAYDIVLNDYKKAKSLFGDTQVST